MKDVVEQTAPSVDEAVSAAMAELGVTSEQDVIVRVLQEPKGGFSPRPAIVEVRLKPTPSELPPPEVLEEQGEIAADFLEELLSLLGVEADIEPNLEGGTMYVDLFGVGAEAEDDMALLIGRGGATLDALQELTRAVVSTRMDERPRVVVDIEDYRKRARSRLEDDAREIAYRIAKEGGEEEFEPMNAYDRKVIHDVVAQISGVESFSRGEGADRRVVIRAL